MKYIIHIILIVALICAGFWGYTRYSEAENLKRRVADATQAMEQNFSLMMDGWNLSQTQMLFAQVPDADKLKAHMDSIRGRFGACHLEPAYVCQNGATVTDTEMNVAGAIFCRFNMSCEKTVGLGEVTWVEKDGIMKVRNFRVRRR